MAFEVGSIYVTQTTFRKWLCVRCTPDYAVLESVTADDMLKMAHVVKLRQQTHSGFYQMYTVDAQGTVHTHNNGTFKREDIPYDPLQNAEEEDSI